MATVHDTENGTSMAGMEDSQTQSKVSWHAESVAETIRLLKSSPDLQYVGLTDAEAKERLAVHGENKLSEKRKETIWEKIWKQVSNVLVLILVTIAIFSAARAIVEMVKPKDEQNGTTILTSWAQVGLITLVITVNTAIGIYQEGSAQKAAEALKNMLSADARVIRDGHEKMVSALEIVPGDIVMLSLGDRVPADLRLFKVSNLAAEEAALTGESVPIDKSVDAIEAGAGLTPEQVPLGDRHNMAFSATLIAQGSGVGVVVATGDNTQIGTINALVSQVETKRSNVLKQIDEVSKLLAFLIFLATMTTFFIAWQVGNQEIPEAISTALVCCVAMVPEGLEAIVTLVYAWAVTIMARQQAIIRVLPSVETLGSVTCICSDKTGTLTQNIMSLTAFVTSNARYRFDVNSTERVSTNFVRDNSFISERAVLDLAKKSKKKASTVKIHVDPGQVEVDLKKEGAQAPQAEVSGDSTPVANGQSPSLDFIRSAIECGVLCSNCVLGNEGGREGQIGNPTELSILRAAYFSGVDIEQSKSNSPQVAEVPFSSEYKFMATVHDIKAVDEFLVYAKGAPDRMVDVCSQQAVAGQVDVVEPIDAAYWQEQIAILSSHGLRVLALCRATVPKSEVSQSESGEGAQLGPEFINGRPNKQWMTMIGLCAIVDPPRPECVDAIKEAHIAGVRVAMITGDHKDTAVAIGNQLGIVDEDYPSAVTGPEMDDMTDEELVQAVMSNNVFARASPANKIRIVGALQSQNQICSMTGDGVNDAPALKAADMGVAMGKEGTEVAREASEMILADDNFATIVVAVREGRVVWDNLRKVLFVNTPINNAQGMSVLFGLAFGLKWSPLSPIQVLYSNLICAITLGFVCAIEPAEEGIMLLPPRRIGKRLIGRYLLLRILIATFTLTFLVVGSSFFLMSKNNPPLSDDEFYSYECVENNPDKYCIAHIRSVAFNVLDFGAISITLSARFAYLSSVHPRVFTGNKYVWYSVFLVALLQVMITYIPGLNDVVFQMAPMDGTAWGAVFVSMIIVFVVVETEKAIRSHLKFKGLDTDDREYDELLGDEEPSKSTYRYSSFLPKKSFAMFKRGASNKKIN